MEEVDPTWSVAVVVCGNERAAGSSRGCCGRERGRELRMWLRDRARAEGIRSALVVHLGGCMDVCGAGTTVALHGRGGDRRVLVVEPDDREALWHEVVRAVRR
ncbi:MAG: hypothetical protein R3F61_10955 [Myxococcota bacterium]